MCIRDSLGAERVTVQNLDVVKVDAENNLIAVRGAIPGPRGGVVLLSESVMKAVSYTHLDVYKRQPLGSRSNRAVPARFSMSRTAWETADWVR